MTEKEREKETDRDRQTDRQREENRAHLALIDFTGAKILGWHHTSRGHDANQFIEVGI